eukprot:1316897-Ditylum_brightwellii.AAC.1
MSSRGQSKTNDASSAAESAAATLSPPPAPPRQSPQQHKTPSPVKQANSKEGKKKQASPIF